MGASCTPEYILAPSSPPLVISITRVLNIDSDICTCLQTEVKYEEIYKYVLSLHFSDVH